MKKYVFGLFAIGLAVAFSAFTAPKKSTLNMYQFTGTAAQVGNPAFWAPASPSCNSTIVDLICTVESELNEADFDSFVTGKTQAQIEAGTVNEKYYVQ